MFLTRHSKKVSILVIFLAHIVGWTTGLVQASNAFSPQDIIQSMRSRFEQLKDYQCQTFNTSFKKGAQKVESHNYYFKKPSLIRLEVTGGNDKGAVAIFNSKGKVRAKAGGILGIFTITMEPNDKRLQDRDGNRFVDSHFGGTIADIERALSGGTTTVSEATASGRKLLKLEIERPDKRDLILVDPEVMLPVEWQSIRSGKVDSKTEWRNIKVDAGLKESLFDM